MGTAGSPLGREHIGRQQFDQPVGHADAAEDDAHEIHEPRPDDGRAWFE
ncbi:hypothetical protein RAA17_11665 [Komagataeibacter rhaeticus]|nr:hypothetical protein [Komagataeibacter rhaeticus]